MTEELREKLKQLPKKPGVYLMKDSAGQVLYVGKATQLADRVRSYFTPTGWRSRGRWIQMMVDRVADVEVIVTRTPAEALLLELNLIRMHRPPFNSRLTDDKHYPYLCITFEEDFPRLIVVRRTKQDGNEYFGPYSSSKAMRQTVNVIRRIFGVCSCKLKLKDGEPKGQVCLDYHLGLCPGPCAGLISKEEYRANMRRVAAFLRGRQEDIIKTLKEKMKAEAEALRFENAARLRDQIAAIERVREKQKAISTEPVDQDILGLAQEEQDCTVAIFFVRAGRIVDQQSFTMRNTADRSVAAILTDFIQQYYSRAAFIPKEILVETEPEDSEILAEWLSKLRGNKVHLVVPQRGEKRRLVELVRENASIAGRQAKQIEALERERAENMMEELREILRLDATPRRIECFDISTLRGQESVGSMVVFEDALPAKSEYRRFKVRFDSGAADDYAMMREVLARRFSAMGEDEKFSRMPDLLVVDGGKGQLNVARRVLEELNVHVPVIALAKEHEHVFVPGRKNPIVLDHTNPALRLLIRLRDEAHRFAITYHRKLRSKAASRSMLDEIPGIGPARKRALLQRFSSISEMRKATIDELAAVPGMNTTVAARLHKYLNPTKTYTRRRRRGSAKD